MTSSLMASTGLRQDWDVEGHNATSIGERQRKPLEREAVLMAPQMRSMRLIGDSNPRYRWNRYYKTDEELRQFIKPLQNYYRRTNFLISQYVYIDRLLDSSLPHDLIQEFGSASTHIPAEHDDNSIGNEAYVHDIDHTVRKRQSKVKRNPKDSYRLPDETAPLLESDSDDYEYPDVPMNYVLQEATASEVNVSLTIYLAVNTLSLAGYTVIFAMTASMTILACLASAALDLLSSLVVWRTTNIISQTDQYAYPTGRRKLEPISFLIFSVVAITTHLLVALECIYRIFGADSTAEMKLYDIFIIIGILCIKIFGYMWCWSIGSTSIQALARNRSLTIISALAGIVFPIVSSRTNNKWLDSLGGLLLSLSIMIDWSRTTLEQTRNLTGKATSNNQHSNLLYLVMRFAKSIKQISGLTAYHSGDTTIVEVDIVLDGNMSLRDSHDLSESLQYVLESVPNVDRAFVHQEYSTFV